MRAGILVARFPRSRAVVTGGEPKKHFLRFRVCLMHCDTYLIVLFNKLYE